jgi:phosphoribosylglycinamide formyltransferase-1
MNRIIRIAILASGGGSNAHSIMTHFSNSELAQIVLVVTNKAGAGVLEKAAKYSVPTVVLGKGSSAERGLKEVLEGHRIDFVVLAGYLKIIPREVVALYNNKMVNIHPSLLPKFGGKGMYGMNVHRAVIEAGESESGMTIHWVNEKYDEGGIIFQGKVPVDHNETAESLQKKVLILEHKHYPEVIEKLLIEMKAGN